MQNKEIKLFYDGTNIEKYGLVDYIQGFTTNTTIMVQGNELNYTSFYEKNKNLISNRPISFQLFSDDYSEMLLQAKKIAALGDNVYVKVPVIKSNGESNNFIIHKLLEEGIKLNITAIFTEEQLINLYDVLKHKPNNIVLSIFAGRISDTGKNPFEIIQFACKLYPFAEILWAGCKEVLSIKHAIDAGCKIITIPDSIMDRLSRINKDLTEFSQETVLSFKKDGEKITI